MTDTTRRSFSLATLGLAGGLTFARAARAQPAFPGRPMRLLVGFPAGGSVDIVARAIVERLNARLGQPTVVENRPGAAGNIAAGLLAKAPNDGYTTYVATSVNAVSPSLYKEIQYDPARDFAPIARWITTSYMVVVSAAQPMKTFGELVEYAMRNPGRLNYGSQGYGSPPHLAGELLSLRAGLKMVHVPFKGGPEVMSAVLAGDVHVMFAPIPIALPLVRSGRLRLLGMTGLQRSALVPDVPTLAEQGMKDFEVIAWYGTVAPAGTPQAVVDLLARETVQVLELPEVRQSLIAQGMDPAPLGPAAFASFLDAEIRGYAKLIADARIERI